MSSEHEVNEEQARKELIELLETAGIDFDKHYCLVEIDGVVVNTTPIRVGVGKDETGAADLPVIRDVDGEPYIPGSSIKGVLRSLAEKITFNYWGIRCDPFTDANRGRCSFTAAILKAIKEAAMLYHPKTMSAKFEEEARSRVGRLLGSEWRVEEALIDLVRKFSKGDGNTEGLVSELVNGMNLPCPVCRLFGNTELSSHIQVLDLRRRDSEGRVIVQARTRVAIDRFRGAARPGALFDYEFIPQNYEWRLKIRLVNVNLRADRPQDRLMKALLKYFSEIGITVGSMKSVGLGVLKLDASKTKVREYTIKNLKVEMREYLLSEVLGSE